VSVTDHTRSCAWLVGAITPAAESIVRVGHPSTFKFFYGFGP
jgi:hypothetical protein